MPIPTFNEIKAPALAFFADGKPHRVKEVFEALAPMFHLTESELSRRSPYRAHHRPGSLFRDHIAVAVDRPLHRAISPIQQGTARST